MKMSRRIHRLTVRQIAAAKLPEGKDHVMLPDGGNLYLQLTSGTGGEALNRSWIFRYQLDGRRRDLGLGPYHDRSLAEAREKARAFRQQLLDGGDPAAEPARLHA